jgi:O-antigen ligase
MKDAVLVGMPHDEGRLRAATAALALALPVLILTWERFAGLVGLAWLLFCLYHWRSLSAYPARWRVYRNSACLGFLACAGIVALLALVQGEPLRVGDNPSRFALVLPAVAAIACFKPSRRIWFAGVAASGIYVGILALAQVLAMGLPAAGGFTNQNKFGFISATFALLCAAALRLPRSARPPPALIWLGIAGASTAMILSSTRGAWLAFFAALLFWLLFSVQIRLRRRLMAIGLLALITGLMAVDEGAIVQRRLHSTMAEIEAYRAGNVTTSTGHRLEMWRASMMMIRESPWIGVGLGRFQESNLELISEGEISPAVGEHAHPHNEYLAWFASGGVLGLGALLAAMIGPLAYFLRIARGSWPTPARSPEADRERRAIGLAGALLVTATAIFIITDAYFFIHYATVYYALTVAILVGFAESLTAKR